MVATRSHSIPGTGAAFIYFGMRHRITIYYCLVKSRFTSYPVTLMSRKGKSEEEYFIVYDIRLRVSFPA